MRAQIPSPCQHFPALLVLAAMALPLHPVAAQDLRLTGQLRPRFEQRDPNIPAAPAGDVTMRARLGVVGVLPEELRLRVDVQDVLIWGAGAGTPGFSGSIEVHQAFLDVGALGAGVTGRIGRQEVVLGNQRLVSNNNWGQRGQRFDGVRLLRAAPPAGVPAGGGLAGSAFVIRTAESGIVDGPDAWFHGVHGALGIGARDTVQLYGLYNRRRDDAGDTDQFTAGGHATAGLGDLAGISLSGEAYMQLGTRAGRDVRAWMAAVAVGGDVGPGRLRVGYDHYSGDPDPLDDTARTFDRLFGSNHAFHGYADLFTNIPATTGQRGLGDLHLRTTWPLDARSELELNGHAFRAPANRPDGFTRFGEEVDLVLRHRLRGPLTLEGGGSWFTPGPAMTALRPFPRDLWFGYLMATLQF